jgi:hypothetical protein
VLGLAERYGIVDLRSLTALGLEEIDAHLLDAETIETIRRLTAPGLSYQSYFNLYLYAEGNPLSLTDPLGLWSITISAFRGPGGAVIFGQNPNGSGFLTVRVGAGIGGGIKWDPLGQRPGDDPGDCTWGLGAGGYAAGDINLGPFFLGATAATGVGGVPAVVEG